MFFLFFKFIFFIYNLIFTKFLGIDYSIVAKKKDIYSYNDEIFSG